MRYSDKIKLTFGIVAPIIYTEKQGVDFLHPHGISVFFQVNIPQEYNAWYLLYGENYALTYLFFNEGKTLIKWDKNIAEHGILSDEEEYFSDLFLPLAKNIAAKATEKKLFNEITCTKEAQTINFHSFDDFVEGAVKIKREWFNFFFDKDYNVAEAKSKFRHYFAGKDYVCSLIPNENLADRFIEAPHIDRERRRANAWPNTNLESVDSWLEYYGLNKPVTLEVEVNDEMRRHIRTRENKDEWKYMTREEYEAASKADPEKYTPVPKRKS